MHVKKKKIEELYELYKVRYGYLTEHMDYALSDEERSIKAYEEGLNMDEQIDRKTDEIGEESGIATAFFVNKLLDAVFPRPLSVCIQCLKECNVEVSI